MKRVKAVCDFMSPWFKCDCVVSVQEVQGPSAPVPAPPAVKQAAPEARPSQERNSGSNCM